MSRTTMWIADQSGEMFPGQKFENSWRSAAAVWEHLGQRWGYSTEGLPLMMDREALKALWRDAGNPDRPWYERLVLGCTFDRALIRREEFATVAACMDRVAREMNGPQSLTEQAEELRRLSVDETATAVGWQQTSVAADLWRVYDEDSDEERPYCIATDHDHVWVMEFVGQKPREEP